MHNYLWLSDYLITQMKRSQINFGHLAHLEGEIFLPAKNRAHRLRDLRRQQARNRNLIQ